MVVIPAGHGVEEIESAALPLFAGIPDAEDKSGGASLTGASDSRRPFIEGEGISRS